MIQLEGFSDDMLAGQRIMAGFAGTTLNDDLRFLIGELKVGGIILFAINIENPAQLTSLCESAQAYALACGQPELLIAVDQEGGQVARLREPFTLFPGGAPAMKTKADAENFGHVTAKELAGVGINMDMAPVLDVTDPDIDSVMKGRSFGDDPERVAELGCAVIDSLQGGGVMAVAKHFPGIGRTTLDSHFHLPRLDASEESLSTVDLSPFRAAIGRNVSGIMLSHILYSRMDDRWPASLSVKIAKELLREKMGYDGVLITDDLDMKAIRLEIETVVERILAAHIDITLICHKGPNIEKAFRLIRKGHAQSPEARRNGLASVERIMALKAKYLTTHTV